MDKFREGDSGLTEGGWAYRIIDTVGVGENKTLTVSHWRKNLESEIRSHELNGSLCGCSFCRLSFNHRGSAYNLLEPERRADPIPAAITEYHDACAAFEEAQLAVEKAKARIEDARLALKEALG